MTNHVVVGVIFCLALVATADSGRKNLAGFRAEQSPIVDGKLSEPCWRKAGVAKDFTQLYREKTPTAEQTTARVVYDNEALYFGIDCLESDMILLKQSVGKGARTFDYDQGETIEIFLDAARNRKDFFHIMVNTNGTWITEGTDSMQLRNIDIKSAVAMRADGFSFEIRIPFAVLHLQANPDRTWGLNINRARMIGNRPGSQDPNLIYSSWQHTGGAFRQPKKFGDMKLDADLSAYFYEVAAQFENDNLRVTVENRSGRENDLFLETTLGEGGKPERQRLKLSPDKIREFTLPLRSGKPTVSLVLKEAGSGKVLYRGGTALVERAVGAGPARSGELSSTRGYTVFVKHYLERGTGQTIPKPEEVEKPLVLAASPGEYEPVSFAVRAQTALTGVVAELAGDLAGPDGSRIPAGCVEVRCVELMKRWLSPTEYERVECYLTRVKPRSIPVNTTQRYWLTAHVPSEAPPGLYTGTVRVAPDNASAVSIPLRLEVLPIKLSPPEDMAYFMYYSPAYLPAEIRTLEYQKKIFEDMKAHGLTTATLYLYPDGGSLTEPSRDCFGTIPMMDAIRDAAFLSKGIPVIWIGAECYDASIWKSMLEEGIKRNWPEMLFYLIDEPVEGRYENVEAIMKRVDEFRKTYPELKFKTTTAGAGNLRVCKYYDVWIAGAYSPGDIAQKAAALGKKAWMYDCRLAPVDALTDRYYFGYWCWKAGIKGVSHWAYFDLGQMNRFMTQTPWRNSLDDLTENTHQYDYVWPLKEEIVPSIGWEAVREGIDDYRYIKTLEKLIALARSRKIALQPAADAEKLLGELGDQIHPDNLSKERAAASKIGEETNRRNECEFNRKPPEPSWQVADYDGIRRRIARQIIALNEAILSVDQRGKP